MARNAHVATGLTSVGSRYIVSDTLSRLAQKHGVDVVYEAAKEWVAYIDQQKAIMVKHGMNEPAQRDGVEEGR